MPINKDGNQQLLKISEIFCSIQGEGISSGTPCIFLRLSNCNLKCSWCDTKYTWDWDNYDITKEIKEISIDEVVKRIYEFSKINRLVITGGEPLLQQNKLIILVKKIKNKDKGEKNEKPFYIEIETNGTILPNKELIGLIDQWNISPKTSNSNNGQYGINLDKIYEDSLTFCKNLENAFFKFVIDNNKDLVDVEQVIKKFDLPRSHVILMPQATTKEKIMEKSAWLKEYANENNTLFSSRLQVLLWDNQRGK